MDPVSRPGPTPFHRTVSSRSLLYMLNASRHAKQAVCVDPVGRPGPSGSPHGRRALVESGLFRLTCPLLVKVPFLSRQGLSDNLCEVPLLDLKKSKVRGFTSLLCLETGAPPPHPLSACAGAVGFCWSPSPSHPPLCRCRGLSPRAKWFLSMVACPPLGWAFSRAHSRQAVDALTAEGGRFPGRLDGSRGRRRRLPTGEDYQRSPIAPRRRAAGAPRFAHFGPLDGGRPPRGGGRRARRGPRTRTRTPTLAHCPNAHAQPHTHTHYSRLTFRRRSGRRRER